MGLRSGAKHIAEHALVWSGAAALARRRLSRSVLVLAYHNVVPDGARPAGDLPNHLPLASFRAQLDALQETHDVVPLADFARDAPDSVRPRVAITFDDAYTGAIRHAVPELVRRGLPATLFVAPAFLGGRSFWWDALTDPSRGGLDPELRGRALGELRGDDATVRAWARGQGVAEGGVPELLRAASETELMRAAGLPGITLGSHSWSHPNLTRLDPRELREELSRPLAWLHERVQRPLRWIAYPYGSYDRGVAEAAAAAGYEGGLAITGGWMRRPPGDPMALPRLNIPPGLSRLGFILRLAGVGA
jgi:peptidoglycan/xylan/chitin deacetylase (PgdA/CDA1 family)